MYAGLRTNLPREIMSFLEFPFDATFLGNWSVDDRRFPVHEEVCFLCDILDMVFTCAVLDTHAH